jgi:TetR/AcrR family transcriptional regulator
MHTENKDEMRDKILEAALKRFSQFSAAKTTMNEIADDLHCSKASLYYYFPDKNGLHNAVLAKVGEFYFKGIEETVQNMTSGAQALRDIIKHRHDFIKKFCRLELFKILKDGPPAQIAEAMMEVKRKETDLIAKMIEKGVQDGDFEVDDAVQAAELYNQALIGLRFSVLEGIPHLGEPTHDEFDLIISKQKQLAEIFIKGISK